jgi:uncharacterized FlaG/YvyC family protein
MSNDLLASVSLQVASQIRTVGSTPRNVADNNLESGTPLPGLPHAATQEPTPSNVVDAVDRLNQAMQNLRRDILFSIDEQSGETVIQVKNQETGEVIRQIPSEEVLVLARQHHEVEDKRPFLIQERA